MTAKSLTIDRRSWIAAGGLSFALTVLYLVFLPSRLTWANYGGDGGDFLAAMLSGGVPHPSGYPTYMLLGRLFQLLPFGTPYWRAALLSALSVSSAAGLLCLWTAGFAAAVPRQGWQTGLAAGLLWGLAPLVWSQAVIVEVYGLQALFVVLWLWWIGLLARGGRGWVVGLLAGVAGLSTGNHLTILLMAPAAAWWLWKAARQGGAARAVILQIALAGAGLLVYLYLPLSASRFPPVNWGNPQSWQGFLWTVSGQPYRSLLFHLPSEDLLGRLSAWARLLIEQFALPGLVLGVVGAVQCGLKKFPQALLLWIFAAYSLFAIGYKTADSILYLIPALLAAAVWAGQGLVLVWPWMWRNLPLGKAAALLLVVFIAVQLPGNARKVDPRHDEAEAYAQAYLRDAPANAILLTRSDADTFPLWYAVYGLGMRRDTVIVVLPLTAFAWYRETLMHTYPDLVFPPAGEPAGSAWGEALPPLNPNRPVCRSQASEELNPKVTYDCR